MLCVHVADLTRVVAPHNALNELARLRLPRAAPVCVVSFEEFDELLRDDAISSMPYSELRAVAAVTRRRAEGRNTSLRRAITSVRWRGGVEAGWRPELVGKTPARVAVDQCLATGCGLKFYHPRMQPLTRGPEADETKTMTECQESAAAPWH